MNRIIRRMPVLVLVVVVGGLAAISASVNALTASDDDFVIKATMAGMKEVELARLAVKRGQSQTVIAFARRMIADHTKAGNELRALARARSIKLPAAPDTESKAAVDQLSHLSPAEFDHNYMAMAVADHEAAVADFQSETESGVDATFRDFATRTLPTLQDHLRMARDTALQLK